MIDPWRRLFWIFMVIAGTAVLVVMLPRAWFYVVPIVALFLYAYYVLQRNRARRDGARR
jgi:CDP-diglyceride synthetase